MSIYFVVNVTVDGNAECAQAIEAGLQEAFCGDQDVLLDVECIHGGTGFVDIRVSLNSPLNEEAVDWIADRFQTIDAAKQYALTVSARTEDVVRRVDDRVLERV